MSYLYSKSSDFPGGFEIGQFTDSILSSSIGSIFITSKINGDIITIRFTTSLTAPQLSVLTNLISSHVPYNLETVDNIFYKESASSNPSSTDDCNKGYCIGSLWRNTTQNNMYMCVDNTGSNSVWRTMGAGGVSELFSGVDNTGGVDISSGWTDISISYVHKQTSNISHSGAEITINTAGTFVIQGYISTVQNNGTNSASEGRLVRDTGSGYVEVVGTRVNMNHDSQDQDDRATGAFTITMDVSAGHRFKLQAQRIAGTGVIYTMPSSGINIFNPGIQGLPGPTGPTGSAGGITTINALTSGTQTLEVGTAGTDFAINSSTSTHTFNLPSASASARGVITTGAQTIAGVKTFTSAPVISAITNGGTVTIPSGTDTLVGRNTTDTLTNKSLVDTSTAVICSTDGYPTRLQFNCAATSNTVTTLTFAQTADRTVTLPDATTTLVGTNATQTLTNKTFTDSTTTFQDNSDNTKKFQFQASSVPTGNTLTFTVPNLSCTLVCQNSTDTLTNKTITATSNTVRATQLGTTTTDVTISGASAPTSGQVLVTNTPTTATWQNFTGLTWRSTWNGNTAYAANDVVTYSNACWVCILGHTNQVPPNAIYWDQVVDGFHWKGTWNSGTTYVIDDIAYLGGSSYICILGHTNQTPPNVTYWQPFAAACVFGQYYQSAVSETSVSTTSTTFQNKLTMTTPSLPSGTYRIGWQYMWQISSTSVQFRGRTMLNGATTLQNFTIIPQSATTTLRHPISGFYNTGTISGVQTITIDYCVLTTGTAYIEGARLEIWQVA